MLEPFYDQWFVLEDGDFGDLRLGGGPEGEVAKAQPARDDVAFGPVERQGGALDFHRGE